MPFNINTFKENGLRYGGARPSLFEVNLSIPQGVGISPSTGKLVFTCRASSIPASTISPIEVPYFGRKIKLAGDRTFADWSVTVMNDEDYTVRKMFEQWTNKINSHLLNEKSIPLNEYKANDTIVYHYSKTGIPIAQYTFTGLFPTEISAMDLDWDSTNSIQTFNVNFAYDYWTSESVTGVGPGVPAIT
jgi:hypothetical protein